MNKIVSLVAVALLALSGSVMAGETGADFTASANVLAECQVSSPTITFPEASVLRQNQYLETSGTLQINCTGAIPYAVEVTGNQDEPFKKAGTNTDLTLRLFQDSGHTQRWSNEMSYGVGSAISGTSVGGSEGITFYARAVNTGVSLIDVGDYVALKTVTITF